MYYHSDKHEFDSFDMFKLLVYIACLFILVIYLIKILLVLLVFTFKTTAKALEATIYYLRYAIAHILFGLYHVIKFCWKIAPKFLYYLLIISFYALIAIIIGYIIYFVVIIPGQYVIFWIEAIYYNIADLF